MKNKLHTTFILFIIIGLTSCGQDRLTPAYKPMTINQLTNSKPIKFTYQIDDTRIDEYDTSASKFPVFGKLFKAIAKAVANAKIGKDGGMQIDLPLVTVDLSQLLRADFSTISSINLEQLDVFVRDPKSIDSLKFLDKIEIWAKLSVPIDDLEVDEKGYTRMLYYDRTEKGMGPGCNEKCLVLKSVKIDWKQFLLDNPTLEIKPLIFINSVPNSTMKLAGSIDYSIKFNVGF